MGGLRTHLELSLWIQVEEIRKDSSTERLYLWKICNACARYGNDSMNVPRNEWVNPITPRSGKKIPCSSDPRFLYGLDVLNHEFHRVNWRFARYEND